MSLRLLLPVIAICTWACAPGALTQEELKAYALDPEHGLHKSVVDGGIVIDVIYRPKDLIIAQEVGLKDAAAWDKEAQRIDSLDYFVFTIKKHGKALENYYSRDPQQFQHALSYLSDGIAQDIHLQVDGRRIVAEGVAFVQGFGVTNTSQVLVVFRSVLSHQSGNFTVELDGTELELGLHRFEFDTGDLRSIPGLTKN